MSTVDAYGQSVSIAGLEDAPNAQTLAFNIVSPVVPRSVMRFSTASARNAALSSPVAGMTAFLSTEKLLTVYDGTAWVVVAAGTSAWTTPTLATGFTADGNSNGTPQYRIVNLFGEQSVMWRGGVNLPYTGSTINNTGLILNAALPAAARPSSLRTVTAACSAASSTSLSLKIDFQTDGQVKVVGTGTGITPPWISLNNITYSL
jgi:hypothetical protein